MNKENNPSPITPEEFEKQFHHAYNLQETGELNEALLIYESLLNILSGSPLLHFNCALAYFDKQNFDKAESHYGKAVTIAADAPDIHYNRGLNFRKLQRYQDAAQSFKDAFKSGDTTVDTLYNLALCRQDSEDYSKAGRLYNIILSQDSTHQPSLNNFAYLCHKSGDTEQAASLYEQLLTLNPEHQAAQHMLNSLTGATSDIAPLKYVESVFDNYAENFEHSLIENLHYKTPKVLYNFYCQFFQNNSQNKCLNLGCGTGLAGEQFKPCCKKLIGVDISQKMLEIAEEKNLYNTLVKDDIIHFLQVTTQKYNLILAADVFTYMGNLENIFQECCDSIEEFGILLFSVEEACSSDKGFELKQTGRFGHTAIHIKTLSTQTEWAILGHQASNLRQDKGKWIKGHIFLLQKTRYKAESNPLKITTPLYNPTYYKSDGHGDKPKYP